MFEYNEEAQFDLARVHSCSVNGAFQSLAEPHGAQDLSHKASNKLSIANIKGANIFIAVVFFNPIFVVQIAIYLCIFVKPLHAILNE